MAPLSACKPLDHDENAASARGAAADLAIQCERPGPLRVHAAVGVNLHGHMEFVLLVSYVSPGIR